MIAENTPIWGKIDFEALEAQGIETLDDWLKLIAPGQMAAKIEVFRCITCQEFTYLVDPKGQNEAVLLWYSALSVCPDCDNAPVQGGIYA